MEALLFKFYKQPSQRHSSVHLDEIAHNVGPFDLILAVCFDTNLRHMFWVQCHEIPYWSSSTGYMPGSGSKKSPWEEKKRRGLLLVSGGVSLGMKDRAGVEESARLHSTAAICINTDQAPRAGSSLRSSGAADGYSTAYPTNPPNLH